MMVWIQKFGGIDNTLYPRPIIFTLGLNVNLQIKKKNEKTQIKLLYFIVIDGVFFSIMYQ
jgi:hypothetical protein